VIPFNGQTPFILAQLPCDGRVIEVGDFFLRTPRTPGEGADRVPSIAPVQATDRSLLSQRGALTNRVAFEIALKAACKLNNLQVELFVARLDDPLSPQESMRARCED